MRVTKKEGRLLGMGRQGDALVLVQTEMPFFGSGSGCDSGVLKPRRRLVVVSFPEAQMSMLVCGGQYRAAEMVWHSVLEGTRRFRVNRDEKMLEVVVDEVEAFLRGLWGRSRGHQSVGSQKDVCRTSWLRWLG